MTVDILISTIDQGIERAAQVPIAHIHNVKYIIVWQHTNPRDGLTLPAAIASRRDVKVISIEGRGLSRSRNVAIAASTADVCVIADDDVRYTSTRIEAVVDTFTATPTLDVATFKYESTLAHKHYPSESFDLALPPKGYYVSSIEIAFRRRAIQGRVKFDERFGLGASTGMLCGEEELFIAKAVEEGLNCKFYPVVIVHHSGTTTSMRPSPGVLKGMGAVIGILHPHTARLRLVLKAWRVSCTSHISPIVALRHLRHGYHSIHHTPHR